MIRQRTNGLKFSRSGEGLNSQLQPGLPDDDNLEASG
jgi:hypothetical protein